MFTLRSRFERTDNTLASDLYDYLSKCGVNGDSLPFHQITDKEQLEMVDLILIANQECAVTYDYTNSRIKIKFPSGEQSANYCYYNFDYLYDFEYTIK